MQGMKLKGIATEGKVNMEYSDERAKKKFQKFQKEYKEMFTPRNAIQMQKYNYTYIDYMANNSLVLDMINKYSKDTEFKNQIK